MFSACAALAATAAAADWPMYRADGARSGYTAEVLPARLTIQWTHKPAHRPAPAWPDAGRLGFDRAFQPVVAAGLLYYGSSADGKLYALDAATGAERWTFFTNDLLTNKGTQHYGSIRPGCWINVLVGGGLVLAPDGAQGCRCAYQNHTTSVVLQPLE